MRVADLDESVFVHDQLEAVAQQPGLVLIPTLATSTHGTSVKVHIYNDHPAGIQEQAAGLCRELCDGYGASRGRLVWFSLPGSRPLIR